MKLKGSLPPDIREAKASEAAQAAQVQGRSKYARKRNAKMRLGKELTAINPDEDAPGWRGGIPEDASGNRRSVWATADGWDDTDG
jgi:hypothetical protein